MLAGVGSVAALYVRTSRFYMFTYLEAALAIAFAVSVFQRGNPFKRAIGVLGAVSIFVIGETLPLAALWPPSPSLLLAMAAHTLNISIGGGPGFLDQMRAVRSLTEGSELAVHGASRIPIGIVRRLLGPFPWMLPDGWTFSALQRAEFYLYPAVLAWYALLPFVVVGFSATMRPAAARSDRGFSVLLVSLFSLLCGAQYLFIDSSYRQREILIPVLLLIAWYGFVSVRERHAGWRWYRWVLVRPGRVRRDPPHRQVHRSCLIAHQQPPRRPAVAFLRRATRISRRAPSRPSRTHRTTATPEAH